MKAAMIAGEHGWLNELMEVARAVDKSNEAVLKKCADFCRQHNNHKFAKEIYVKLDDVQSLMELHIELHHWEEAFMLASAHEGRFSDDVFLPYAEWLAISDRFEEAQEAYKKAGRPDLSRKILQQLTHNAVVERRYQDAGYYFWILAQENLKMVGDGDELSEIDQGYRQRFHEYSTLAELYYAYHFIYQVRRLQCVALCCCGCGCGFRGGGGCVELTPCCHAVRGRAVHIHDAGVPVQCRAVPAEYHRR